MNIIEDKNMVDTAFVVPKWCRSKKKRIRKKWAKSHGHWKVTPKQHGFMAGNTLVVHPDIAHKLRALCKPAPGFNPVSFSPLISFASMPDLGVSFEAAANAMTKLKDSWRWFNTNCS